MPAGRRTWARLAPGAAISPGPGLRGAWLRAGCPRAPGAGREARSALSPGTRNTGGGAPASSSSPRAGQEAELEPGCPGRSAAGPASHRRRRGGDRTPCPPPRGDLSSPTPCRALRAGAPGTPRSGGRPFPTCEEEGCAEATGDWTLPWPPEPQGKAAAPDLAGPTRNLRKRRGPPRPSAGSPDAAGPAGAGGGRSLPTGPQPGPSAALRPGSTSRTRSEEPPPFGATAPRLFSAGLLPTRRPRALPGAGPARLRSPPQTQSPNLPGRVREARGALVPLGGSRRRASRGRTDALGHQRFHRRPGVAWCRLGPAGRSGAR